MNAWNAPDHNNNDYKSDIMIIIMMMVPQNHDSVTVLTLF
jgi:hypothetical protein